MPADQQKSLATSCVLHCDILPLSRHIEAAWMRIVVWVLMNPGDNGLCGQHSSTG